MTRSKNHHWISFGAIAAAGLGLASVIGMKPEAGHLVVYCGRGEELIRPVIERFEEQTGIDVSIRYAGTSELTATLLEEGNHSPADVFFAQDAGALGALNRAGTLDILPADLLDLVNARYRSPDGTWVGVSGRARVLVYNPQKIEEGHLPEDLFGLIDPVWKGRIGWAPENGSFQSFVTALRVREGDERALAWLQGIKANEPRVYAKNSAIVQAVADGEIDVGLVNHYYLYTARRTNPKINAANYYFPRTDAGSLVNVAGVGLLKTSKNKNAALAFIRYLLASDTQLFFAKETSEYPMVSGVEIPSDLKPLNDIAVPDIDLNRLDDLEGTLELIRRAGVF